MQQTKRKTKVGRVVSDKMDKTIVVSVERLARHPLYKRVIRLTTKFKAHDEDERRPHRRHGPHRGVAAAVGDEALAPRRGRGPRRRARPRQPERIVAEEAEVTEAIHAAAHPGRQRDDAEATPTRLRPPTRLGRGRDEPTHRWRGDDEGGQA